MSLTFLATALLPGGMLILTLLLVSRMRLVSMTTLYRFQSLFLGIYATVFAVMHHEYELVIIAVLIIVGKAGLVPFMLNRLAKKTGASERLTSYFRPTALTMFGMLITAGALYAAYQVVAFADNFFVVGVSFALMLLGMFSLIVRTDMFGQVIGFLVMESGVFAFGLALAGGMPFLVEIGAFVDVLTLFVLVILLMLRAQKEHESVATGNLNVLID